eukprot:3051671-Amphidinium_carterae.1
MQLSSQQPSVRHKFKRRRRADPCAVMPPTSAPLRPTLWSDCFIFSRFRKTSPCVNWFYWEGQHWKFEKLSVQGVSTGAMMSSPLEKNTRPPQHLAR